MRLEKLGIARKSGKTVFIHELNEMHSTLTKPILNIQRPNPRPPPSVPNKVIPRLHSYAVRLLRIHPLRESLRRRQRGNSARFLM